MRDKWERMDGKETRTIPDNIGRGRRGGVVKRLVGEKEKVWVGMTEGQACEDFHKGKRREEVKINVRERK